MNTTAGKVEKKKIPITLVLYLNSISLQKHLVSLRGKAFGCENGKACLISDYFIQKLKRISATGLCKFRVTTKKLKKPLFLYGEINSVRMGNSGTSVNIRFPYKGNPSMRYLILSLYPESEDQKLPSVTFELVGVVPLEKNTQKTS